CQELAAQQPLRPINWCSRLLKMTTIGAFRYAQRSQNEQDEASSRADGGAGLSARQYRRARP
ncbi:hypothetical protein FA143_33610, partial [Pseudomonas aeruginosa]|nr:hypothetical protein [Pseudomonas aeruginosa]